MMRPGLKGFLLASALLHLGVALWWWDARGPFTSEAAEGRVLLQARLLEAPAPDLAPPLPRPKPARPQQKPAPSAVTERLAAARREAPRPSAEPPPVSPKPLPATAQVPSTVAEPSPPAPAAPAPATDEHVLAAGSESAAAFERLAELRERLRARIVEHMRARFQYPQLARRRGWQGAVRLRFTVAADGNVSKVELAETSGYSLLDAAALRTAKTLRNVAGIDVALPGHTLLVELTVRYRLTG